MNLLEDLPTAGPDEIFDVLATRPGLKVERIVSHGQASPEGGWYDQPTTEWVLLLAGAAKLLFEGDPSPLHLTPGDWVEIHPHRRHRVEWTHPTRPTIWLAIHYGSAHYNTGGAG